MNNTILLFINGWAGKNSLLDMVMVFCASYLIYLVFLIAATCLGYYIYTREWTPVVYFIASLVVTFGVLQLATLLHFDHRPFMDHHLTQLVQHASGNSFPSDHTTAAAAIALGLLFFTRFKKIGLLLLVAACFIGFARIFVGVHYPADIVGGLLTALVGGGVIYALKDIFDPKQEHKVSFDPQK